jgi:lysophospholipase L1-like esterase
MLNFYCVAGKVYAMFFVDKFREQEGRGVVFDARSEMVEDELKMRSVFQIGLAVCLCAGICMAQDPEIKIALLGDSTVARGSGWGTAFAERFTDEVQVRNFAMGGRSSKSWYDEKRLPAVLAYKPDYVLMQFGHNGQPGKGPKRETDPATTYRDFLKMYVREFRSIDAKPVIISSVTRRRYDENGNFYTTLKPWAMAAGEVASEVKVPFVDLHRSSTNLQNRVGRAVSMTYNLKEGDTSHFNKKGAAIISNLVIQDLTNVVKELGKYLK